MCLQIFHITNIDVPAGVGAPPLETRLPKFTPGKNFLLYKFQVGCWRMQY